TLQRAPSETDRASGRRERDLPRYAAAGRLQPANFAALVLIEPVHAHGVVLGAGRRGLGTFLVLVSLVAFITVNRRGGPIRPEEPLGRPTIPTSPIRPAGIQGAIKSGAEIRGTLAPSTPPAAGSRGPAETVALEHGANCFGRFALECQRKVTVKKGLVLHRSPSYNRR